jgi:probable addiction module antidote protein
MSKIAKTAGITREALYKALRPRSAPRFDTVSRVCAALGVRLVAQPVPASR